MGRIAGVGKLIVIIAAVFAASAIDTCNKGTGNPVSPDFALADSNFVVGLEDMIFTKDSIYLFSPGCNCVEDSPVNTINKTAYHYAMTETNLLITLSASVTAACTTNYYAQFSRPSGSDLKGGWVFDSTWYEFTGNPVKTDSVNAAAINKTNVETAYKGINIGGTSVEIYTNPDTTTFASDFIALYKHSLDSAHIQVDSIHPNLVFLIGVSYKTNDPTPRYDTLRVTNLYRAGTTTYRTCDTTQYTPNPYVYIKSSMCPTKNLPPWISMFIADNQPFHGY